MEHMIGKATEGVVGYLGRNDVEAMKSVKRSMEILRRQAMDIEDEVKKEEMSCKKKMKTEVKSWVKEVNDFKPECDDLEAMVSNSRLPLIGGPVGKMQRLVNQFTEQRNHFNGLVLDDFDNDGVPCSTTKLFGNKIMETFKKIWPCLVVDNISSIGIYGMGGVGKTTLTKHIKFELERENYRVYWVTVSQEFSITSFQDKIANVLRISLSSRDEEHMRANILRAAFDKMEKSVFILDDVWEDFLLEDVGIGIGANRCRLIWTTRSLQVCHRMRCQRHFEVQTLDEQESWDMFKHTLGSETELSKEVESIANLVANRCAGLPLGIVTTAASMRGVTDIREWNSALARLKSYSEGYHEMEVKVFRILEYSFNRLHGCEIPCFLYCCLYPEDYEIEREKLIDLFIFAELIPKRDNVELERDEGRVCLMEEAKNWRGDECVRMHDLIRDMALRITSGRYKSKNPKGVPRFLVKSSIRKSNHLRVEKEEWKDDLAAVSLMESFFDESDNILELPPLMSPKSLSTLIINRANISEIPDSVLQHMCGLKVLNLEWCDGLRSLPNCISDMVNLTALLLEGCSDLKSVPPLGKLKKLRTLNLIGTNVYDVPRGLEDLVNLEHLYMGGAPAAVLAVACAHARVGACEHALEGERALALEPAREHARALVPARARARAPTRALPEGTFSKLNRLQHLGLPAFVHISDLRVLNELQLYVGGLTYNQFLKSRRWPTHYKIWVVDQNEFDGIYCDFLNEGYDAADCRRSVGWGNQMKFTACSFQKVLDVVWPPENLHRLDLYSCSGVSDDFFHRWIDRSKNLYHLRLFDLEELNFLFSVSCPVDELVVANLEGGLRNLRVIELWHLPNLAGLINIERVSMGSLIPPGTFSSLQDLHVQCCNGLKKLFSVQLAQQCLQNLKYLDVGRCDRVEEILANNDDLNGGGEEAIISQTSSRGGHIVSTSLELLLPKLQCLCLDALPKLENVCSLTMMIGGDNPTRFVLINCPKLKRLPSFSSTNISYKIRGSKEWWNSLEWNNPSDKDAVQPYFKAVDGQIYEDDEDGAWDTEAEDDTYGESDS